MASGSATRRNPKTVAALGLTIAACFAILIALLISVQRLYECLSAVRSVYEVDVKALGTEGDLQYETQESRRCFLTVLVPFADDARRLQEISHVRRADLEVSLLTGRLIVLTHDAKRLQAFSAAWDRYTEIRDDMIALALQGRAKEALDLERDRGGRYFELASAEIRKTKAELEASSQAKVASIWETLRRACYEVLGLLIAAIVLAATSARAAISRVRTLRRLNQSENRFRRAFEESAVGIIILDLEGRILYANKAIVDSADIDPAELVGKHGWMLMAEDDRRSSAAAIRRLLAGECDNYRAERRVRGRNGETLWMRVSVSLVRRNGAPAEVIALCENITEQRKAQEQLTWQATHDVLTVLANRRYFEQQLAARIDAAREQGTEVALFYIDLDGFKLVNDAMGHSAGDLLLRDLAARFKNALDPSDLLARLGGDEFAVIKRLKSGERESMIAETAGRLLDCVAVPFEIKAHSATVGASIGVSCFPEHGEDIGQLLQSADAAMYQAKRNGKGYYLFDAEMRDAYRRRIRMQTAMTHGLERGEFSLVFQPLYDAASGALVRFETLCRWTNEELGAIPPAEFIPVAEETGLIHEIGRQILRQACLEAKNWQFNRACPVRVAVNVSALQFSQDDYVRQVADILAETDFPAQLLELELTESVLVRDRDDSIRKMHALRKMGISISIDDFGTGYSSLSYLQMMPVDALKIDRSFTARLDSSPTAVTMIRSVIAMGRTLGLRVVTEGVENQEQLDIVRRLGSDEVQGYFLGRAETAEAALSRVMAVNASADVESAEESAVAIA